MSPDPLKPDPAKKGAAARASTNAEPIEARIIDGDLDDALERLIELSAQRAHADGQREARAASAACLDAAMARLDASREEAVEKLAYTSVELALEITRCLLRAEIPAGRYDLEAIVRESLSLSGAERGRCVVHLNPVDAEAIADVPLRSGTELEPDPNVPRGSVHVTTPQGLLVRDLEEAVKSIGERILGDLH